MSIVEQIYGHLDGEELADLALKLASIHAPEGYEEPVGEAVYQWMVDQGIPAQKQLVAGARFNVIGRMVGVGGGANLAFNSHMDTVHIYKGEAQSGLHDMDGYRAWREDEKLFGLAILNCRGPMSIWLTAAKAIKDAGVRLKGDLVLTAVVGETGAAPIEEYQGAPFLGKGIGTRTAIAYGPQVDYALVSETTDFGMSWVQCGVVYVKINVTGESIYTPRTRPQAGASPAESPNAVVKMSHVVQALDRWASEYPDRHSLQSPCGLVRPKANIGAIRGGSPCRPSETAASCSIYMDIWMAPGTPLRDVMGELRQALDDTGAPASIQVYLRRNGFIGQGVAPLANAVTAAYRDLTGGDPPAVSEDIVSMWRDTNVYNEFGIPALTVGPTRYKMERHKHQTANKYQTIDRYLTIPDMLLAAKIYARTALEICGVA
jgi:acetylornithine deacetylase/succinyl-diaminopimelate desuccinylase-like protein